MILKNAWDNGLKANKKEVKFSKFVHKMKTNKPKKIHEKYDEPEM